MNNVTTTQWGAVWFSFAAGVAGAITVTKASPALIEIQKEISLSLVQIGWIMSSAAVATILLGIYAGSLSRRYGAQRILQLALALIIFSASFSLFISSPSELIASRLIEGIAVILIAVSAPTLISHLSKPSDMGLTMGVWALWMPVGSVLAFLLAPLVLELLGWRWLWACSAVVAIPLLLFSLHIKDPARASLSASITKTSSSVIHRAIVLGLIFTCFTATFFSLITYLPTYLINHYQLSTANAVLVTTLLPAFIIPGNLLAGLLIHRGLSPYHLISYPATALAILISAVFYLNYPAETGLLLLALFGLFLGMIPTAIFAQSPRMADKPSDIGRIMGIVITGQGPGILFAPPLAAFIIGEQQHWQNLYPFYLALATGIIILIRYLKRLQTRH
jgi:MFS family permease|tara:strand:+ start:50146 stop:51321 length:1176 start_codon:yes stop_codon:yes gene_type:complete